MPTANSMRRMPTAFLVLSGGNHRAILAFCRSMAALSVPVFLIARTSRDPILWTRYRRQVLATRTTDAADLDDILRCIREVRQRSGHHRLWLCPVAEFLNHFLLRHRAAMNSAGCDLAFPDEPIYSMLSNKSTLVQVCKAAGIKVPAEYPCLAACPLPCVAKPAVNVAGDGRVRSPWLIYSEADRAEFLRTENSDDFFVQEFVEGEAIYLLFHVDRFGNVLSYSQRNLVQQDRGRSIIAAESATAHLEPIAEVFAKLFRQLEFRGLIMIELRRRPNHDWIVIEANPRFWGPAQLFVDAGADLFHAFARDRLDLPAIQPKTCVHPVRYFWLAGLVETLCRQQRAVWHVAPMSLAKLLLKCVWSDVYLRADSWHLFLKELASAVSGNQRRT